MPVRTFLRVVGSCYTRRMARRAERLTIADASTQEQMRGQTGSATSPTIVASLGPAVGPNPGGRFTTLSAVLALQSAAGNSAVTRLLSPGTSPVALQRQPLIRPPIETELGEIGQLVPPTLINSGHDPQRVRTGPPPSMPTRTPAAPPAERQSETPTGPSPELINFLMRQEGFYAHPDDVSDPNNCTIGYGTLLHRGPCDGTESTRFTRGISREQGLTMIMDRLMPIASSVRNRISAALTQNQLDALIDFAYTTGPGSNLLGDLIRHANAGQNALVATRMRQYTGAANAEGKIVRPPGLVRRRGEEAVMWEGGGYGHGAPGYHRGCRRMIDNCPAPARRHRSR